MTGVEILATKEVATVFAFNWGSFWIFMCLGVGASIVFGIIASIIETRILNLSLVICFLIILGSLAGIFAGYISSTPTEYETQYKVTVSDEVSMNEFLARYEIIDQEGKIYTVREIADD